MTYFPFSLLDYGLAALAVLVMGVMVYLFIQFLSNHLSKVTATLDGLVQITRSMLAEIHRHTVAERDLADEVHELSQDIKQHIRKQNGGE